jgi:hypothetical protein
MYNDLNVFVFMIFCVLFLGLFLLYIVVKWLFNPNVSDNIVLYLLISYWWFIFTAELIGQYAVSWYFFRKLGRKPMWRDVIGKPA